MISLIQKKGAESYLIVVCEQNIIIRKKESKEKDSYVWLLINKLEKCGKTC